MNQRYLKHAKFKDKTPVSIFGQKIIVRNCGKLRVVGNKFLTKILNRELGKS